MRPGALREGGRVVCECVSRAFDGYVQYVRMLLWLLSWWEIEAVLLLVVSPRPAPASVGPKANGWHNGESSGTLGWTSRIHHFAVWAV